MAKPRTPPTGANPFNALRALKTASAPAASHRTRKKQILARAAEQPEVDFRAEMRGVRPLPAPNRA